MNLLSKHTVLLLAAVVLLALSSTSYAFFLNKNTLIDRIEDSGVQYIEYGDLRTVVIPTDDFFVFDTAELSECQLQAMEDIVTLLKHYPLSRINIAGFTDDVGDPILRQQLSFYRAQATLAFLWSEGIELERLSAIGYGKYYDIASNRTIYGSGYNRRVEIQWRAV